MPASDVGHGPLLTCCLGPLFTCCLGRLGPLCRALPDREVVGELAQSRLTGQDQFAPFSNDGHFEVFPRESLDWLQEALDIQIDAAFDEFSLKSWPSLGGDFKPRSF